MKSAWQVLPEGVPLKNKLAQKMFCGWIKTWRTLHYSKDTMESFFSKQLS